MEKVCCWGTLVGRDGLGRDRREAIVMGMARDEGTCVFLLFLCFAVPAIFNIS